MKSKTKDKQEEEKKNIVYSTEQFSLGPSDKKYTYSRSSDIFDPQIGTHNSDKLNTNDNIENTARMLKEQNYGNDSDEEIMSKTITIDNHVTYSKNLPRRKVKMLNKTYEAPKLPKNAYKLDNKIINDSGPSHIISSLEDSKELHSIAQDRMNNYSSDDKVHEFDISDIDRNFERNIEEFKKGSHKTIHDKNNLHINFMLKDNRENSKQNENRDQFEQVRINQTKTINKEHKKSLCKAI